MTQEVTTINWRTELQKIVELFSSKTFPETCAKAFINSPMKPCAKWSFGNQLLMLFAGTDDARGFRQWQEVNRWPRKGSRAFYIFGPVIRTKEVEDEKTHEVKEEAYLAGFRLIPVFRFEDTDGKDLPVYKPRDIPPLMDVAEKFGLKVQYEQLYGKYGQASYDDKTIKLATEDWDVFFHELAHQVHRTFAPKNTHGEDPEAEAIAQLVSGTLARLYGRPADEWTWNYIAHYSENKTPEAVGRLCLKVLQRTEKALKLILETASSGWY